MVENGLIHSIHWDTTINKSYWVKLYYTFLYNELNITNNTVIVPHTSLFMHTVDNERTGYFFLSHPVLSYCKYIYIYIYITNWGKAGLGWRPARPTTAYQGFSNNRHNPVMVYNDLMIRYISVHNYNKDRSQPVTIQCIYTWVGAPVDRRR